MMLLLIIRAGMDSTASSGNMGTTSSGSSNRREHSGNSFRRETARILFPLFFFKNLIKVNCL